MDLYIDGIQADTEGDFGIEFSFQADRLRNPEKTGGRRHALSLPYTFNNRKIFGFAEQITSGKRFNETPHTARLEENGHLLFLGEALLKRSCINVEGRGHYEIELTAKTGWAENMSRTLVREIDWEYKETLSATLVEKSWTDDSPVKFLPVHRNRYEAADYAGEIAPTRILSFEDYHPFLNVRFVIGEFFRKWGYTVSSTFLDGEYFGTLYASGYYPERDIDTVKAKMNFLAGKVADGTAIANAYGQVTTYGNGETSSFIGRIVDTADPYYLDEGLRIEGAFDNGGCFRRNGYEVSFIPNDEVTVGFEYRLRFVTDYRIVSDTGCKGFNAVTLEDSTEHGIGYRHNLENLKNGPAATGYFTVVTYDFAENEEYRLTIYYSDNTVEDIAIPSAAFEHNFTKPSRGSILIRGNGNMVTEWGLFESGAYRLATQDVEIDITLRSHPKYRKTNEAVYFDTVFFSGADPGTSFTLKRGTTLRPVFYGHPLLGAEVTMEEVFAHSKYQLEFLRGVAHLFNLYFYTDELSRTVFIEPEGSFYDSRHVKDWTGRIVRERPLEVSEPGEDRSRTEVYTCRDGDGTTARFNRTHKIRYGQWEATVDNYYASAVDATFTNPFFCPAMDVTGIIPQSWSASWIAVGDREEIRYNYDDGNLNFPPKIVRYLGMEALDEGENWSWPSHGTQYPMSEFHPADGGATLCFDDYEGAEGLNRYYKDQYEYLNRGRKLVLYLHLCPFDIENILFPTAGGGDIRALYKFVIRGETIYARLEEVVGYDPEKSGIAKCTFLKIR